MAVRVRNRPWVAVLADMIEGVVVANRLAPPQSDRLRAELWQATEPVPGADSNVARRVA